MDINYNWISLIDFLGLVQGVLFGILLILGSNKKRPAVLLGLFLLTYSLEVAEAILTDTRIFEQNPQLLFLPLNFYYLSVPLLYLYTRSLISDFSLKKHFGYLLPGLIEMLIFLILFSLDAEKKLEIRASDDFLIANLMYEFASLIFSIYFAYKSIQLIKSHQSEIVNYFSNTERRELEWLRKLAIFIIIFYAIWFLTPFLPEETHQKYAYPILGIINVLFIYWVGISGFRQAKVEMIPEKIQDAAEALPQIQEKGNTNPQFQRLLKLMQEKECYKDPELTLPVLADELGLPRRNLSQLINQEAKSNFNHFINRYRVEAAKNILHDPKFDHLNMLGVAFEVGFNSKATFFAVFKKMERISPGKYKKQRMDA